MVRAYKPTMRMLAQFNTWVGESLASKPGDYSASETSSTVAPSQSYASESSGASSRGGLANDDIVWEDLTFGSQIYPVRKYARGVRDIHLLDTFLELSGVTDVSDGSIKLVLHAIHFLRSCDYSATDIRSILAHASAYFADVYSHCGDAMCPTEVGNVLVTTMFLGHSYIQDETCPLSVWHRHLFKGYCSLKMISDAVLQVMVIRRYVLRLADEDLHARCHALSEAVGAPQMEQFVC